LLPVSTNERQLSQTDRKQTDFPLVEVPQPYGLRNRRGRREERGSRGTRKKEEEGI
jgi:hypothetical protein